MAHATMNTANAGGEGSERLLSNLNQLHSEIDDLIGQAERFDDEELVESAEVGNKNNHHNSVLKFLVVCQAAQFRHQLSKESYSSKFLSPRGSHVCVFFFRLTPRSAPRALLAIGASVTGCPISSRR